MKEYKQIIKVLAVFSFVGIFVFLGLLEYHRSFNPYTWLNPNNFGDYSRDLWNQRKEFYAYSLILSFISFLTSTTFLIVIWIGRAKTKLK